MQRWLAEEGEHAMRLLTRHDTGFQPRLIDAIEDLLRRGVDAGRLELPVDLHELAYVIVRLIESYTYLDLITGRAARRPLAPSRSCGCSSCVTRNSTHRGGPEGRPRAVCLAYGLVVDRVNVSVFVYAPVRNGSVLLTCCLKVIDTGSLETGADQVDFENSTASGWGRAKVPFMRWPGSRR